MIFERSTLAGVCLITPEKNQDDRGFFARIFCKQEFAEHEIVDDFVQSSVSFNPQKGTLRGMHYQVPPHGEAKLIRCTRGAIFDVVIDIRSDSSTRGQWASYELNEDNQHTLYVPEGFAHGFISLADNSELVYHVSAYYAAASARTMPWNHAALGISWPLQPIVISDRDREAKDDPLSSDIS